MISKRFSTSILTGIFVLIGTLHANTDNQNRYKKQEWGLGVVGRYAKVPYVADDFCVSDIMPMLYFENGYLFLDGLDYGVKLYESKVWRASLVSKLRYVDMPKGEQNKYLEDPLDMGAEIRYKLSNTRFLDFAVMDDLSSRYYAYVKYSELIQHEGLQYKPFAEIRWSDEDFNKFYYGHNEESFGSGVDGSVGVDGRYHLASNVYLIGGMQARYIGEYTKKSTFLDKNFELSSSLGIAMMGNSLNTSDSKLSTRPYVRFAYGWATPSDLADALSVKSVADVDDNQFTSMLYGHPLSNNLFGLPIDMYLTSGVVYHKSSSVQKSSFEYVLAMKAYYTTPTKYRVRFGAAEGLSYAESVAYIESHEMDEKGYDTSKLMNYADFTIDLNLGDIFGKKLETVWLGAGVHHRSSIFESSSMFGRIKGGSNYNSLYLQWHF